MNWKLIGYSLACVVVPVAWGLMIVWVSNRMDQRFLHNGQSAPGRKRPIEYHI